LHRCYIDFPSSVPLAPENEKKESKMGQGLDYRKDVAMPHGI